MKRWFGSLSVSCLLQYKNKISDEMDLKKRIQSLEESMELHERMKRQALAEFESYRQRVEDMQLCTEAQVHAASPPPVRKQLCPPGSCGVLRAQLQVISVMLRVVVAVDSRDPPRRVLLSLQIMVGYWASFYFDLPVIAELTLIEEGFNQIQPFIDPTSWKTDWKNLFSRTFLN